MVPHQLENVRHEGLVSLEPGFLFPSVWPLSHDMDGLREKAFCGLRTTWAKWGRFGLFPVLCLLAYGDTALKS